MKSDRDQKPPAAGGTYAVLLGRRRGGIMAAKLTVVCVMALGLSLLVNLPRLANLEAIQESKSSEASKILSLEREVHRLRKEVERLLNRTDATTDDGPHYRQTDPQPLLPCCDGLMQEPHSPFRDGNFLTSFKTSIRWVPRGDGSRQLELAEICRLKRYTASEAHRCLASTHVAMIGDSTTRYQYLSLAHFLERGSFPPRFNRPGPKENVSGCTHRNESGHATCSPPHMPNLCVIDDWRNSVPPEYGDDAWRHFISAVGGGPESGGDGGVYRGRMESSAVKGANVKPGRHVETDLYTNLESNVTLSYVFEGGWGDPSPLQGFWLTNCSGSGTCRVPTEVFDKRLDRSKAGDFDWKQTFPEAIHEGGALRTLLPKPDVAIYGRGHWGLLNESRAKRIMPSLHEWVGGRTGTGRCFFRSSTANYRSLHPDHDYFRYEFRHVRPHVYSAGCSYIDYAYLTETFAGLSWAEQAKSKRATERKSIFVDTVHFLPWVYEELNQVLLNVLCNAKPLS